MTKTFAFFDFMIRFNGKNFLVFLNIFHFYAKKGRKTQKYGKQIIFKKLPLILGEKTFAF